MKPHHAVCRVTENFCGSPGWIVVVFKPEHCSLSCSSGPGRNSTLTSLNACFKARMCSLGFAFFNYIILYQPPGCSWTTCIFTENLYSSSTHHVNLRYAVNALHLHINAYRYWWPCMGTKKAWGAKLSIFKGKTAALAGYREYSTQHLLQSLHLKTLNDKRQQCKTRC